MHQVSLKTKQQFKGRLSRKILLSLLPLAILPILLMGLLVYNWSSRLLVQLYSDQLSYAVERQSTALASLVRAKTSFLEGLSKRQEFKETLEQVVSAGSGAPDFEDLRSQLLQEYSAASILAGEQPFDDFLIVLPDMTILAASLPELEGQKLSSTGALNDSLLAHPRTTATYNTLPGDSGFILVTTFPHAVLPGRDKVILAGITRAYTGHRILLAGEGFHQQAQAYFVLKEGLFVGHHPARPGQLTLLEPSDQQKNRLLSTEWGSVPVGKVEFFSFNQQPALAYTRYIPEMEAGLVVELPEAAIRGTLYSLLPYFISVLLTSSVIAGTVIYLTAHRLSDPLVHLSERIIRFAAGGWHVRADAQRSDEIGLVEHSFNQMAEDLSSLFRSLENRGKGLAQENEIVAEIARAAAAAPRIEDLLQQTVNLLISRCGYYEAAVFILDDEGRHALLYETAGVNAPAGPKPVYRVALDANETLGYVIENKQPCISGNIHDDVAYLREDQPVQRRSEAAVPILMGDHLLGILHGKSAQPRFFDVEQVGMMQTIANLLSTNIYNARLHEAALVNLEEASLLYHATRQIAQAETSEEIFFALIHALKQTSYQSITLAEKNQHLHLLSVHNPSQPEGAKSPVSWMPLSTAEIEVFIPTGNPLLIPDFRQPPKMPVMLLKIMRDWKCQAAALIPVRRAGKLVALFVLGSEARDVLTPTAIQPFSNLAELTATALEKVSALRSMQKRLTELEILNLVSEAVSGQTDADATFAAIHAAIKRSLKVTSFFIALYDAQNQMVSIPYMFDANTIRQVDPFPLGEGLTSILIKTKQPLLLVENTEQRSKELGAKVLGTPAKSWMGVPLVQAGEVLGAIVVQDLEQEHRFNEDDLRLLTMTSRQISAALRSMQLLNHSRTQTERERVLHETTRKIRETMDFQGILAAAAEDLGKTLGAQRTRVVIRLDKNPNGETGGSAQ